MYYEGEGEFVLEAGRFCFTIRRDTFMISWSIPTTLRYLNLPRRADHHAIDV